MTHLSQWHMDYGVHLRRSEPFAGIVIQWSPRRRFRLGAAIHWLVAFACSFSIPSTAHGQYRLRPWLSFGGAAGQSGPANSLAHDRTQGYALVAGGGVLIGPRLQIGIEGTVWRSSTDLGEATATFAFATAIGYPAKGFSLQAGLGVGSTSFPTRIVTVDSSRLLTTRLAIQLGLGYDVVISCPIWLGPFIQAMNTVGGPRNPRIRQGEGSDNAALLQLGINLRYASPHRHGACTR